MSQLRIKQICKEQGITLAELANRLGVLRTSLAQAMARDSFSTTKLAEIATALNVPIWQLFAGPEDVQSEGQAITCPHCGKTIKITIKTTQD